MLIKKTLIKCYNFFYNLFILKLLHFANIISSLKNPRVRQILRKKIHFAGDGVIVSSPYGSFGELSNLLDESLNTFTSKKIKSYDYIIWRAHIYSWCAKNACKLNGDFVELGVWYGMHAYHVCRSDFFIKSKKKFHLVDKFGFSENEANTFSKNVDKYKEPVIDLVKKRFSNTSAKFHQGMIPQILEKNKNILPKKICFLSMDLNSAKYEKQGFEFLYSRIVPGGFVVIDDYSADGYSDTQKYYDNFCKKNNLFILKTPFPSAVFIKN